MLFSILDINLSTGSLLLIRLDHDNIKKGIKKSVIAAICLAVNNRDNKYDEIGVALALGIISLYIKGRFRIIPGNSKSIGNYVFIDNVANGHILDMEKGNRKV